MPVIQLYKRVHREWCGTTLDRLRRFEWFAFHPWGDDAVWRQETPSCKACKPLCEHRFEEKGGREPIAVKIPIDAKLRLDKPWGSTEVDLGVLNGLSIVERYWRVVEPGRVEWDRTPLLSKLGPIRLLTAAQVHALALDPACEFTIVDQAEKVSSIAVTVPAPVPMPITRPMPIPAPAPAPTPKVSISPVRSTTRVETPLGPFELAPGWSIWQRPEEDPRGVTFRGHDRCRSSAWSIIRDHAEHFADLGRWLHAEQIVAAETEAPTASVEPTTPPDDITPRRYDEDTSIAPGRRRKREVTDPLQPMLF